MSMEEYNIMRQNHVSLPSIQPKRLFITEPSQRRFNRYSHINAAKESKDKTQIFSRFMDSSIIKKKQQFFMSVETQRKVDLYGDDEKSLLIPKQCGDRNLRGTKAVFKFYQHYKRLDKIIDETKAASVAQSPYTAMLEKSQKIMAFPSTIGVVRKGRGNSIQIPNYYIGDHKSEIISAALSQVKDVKELILSKNRLTDKGVEHIMDKITNDLTKLNLSNNKITTIHPSLLKILGTGACQLAYLNLENNKLNDESINTMSMVLSLNRSVKYLNLGRNFLTKNCVEALTLIIESSKCLQELYIHWNKINGVAAKPIFEKLQSNSNLLVLDYSHNVISQGSPSIAGAICQMLLKNKSLLHVDLSFNNFTLSESTQIANGLKKNRTIYGFHFLGNFGYVDTKGFLKFDETQENMSAENGHIKIQSLDVVHRRPRIGLTVEKMKDVCWICEGWSPQQIITHLQNTKDKFAEVYLNYEEYKPKVAHVENGWLKFHEMLPPDEIRFYCSNQDKGEFVLENFEVKQERFDAKNGDETVKKLIKKVNFVQKKPHPLFVDGKVKTKILPRTPDVVRKEAKRRWKYADSIWFKEWKKEDQDVTKKCFERDWAHSKISNIVKNAEEQQKVKALLHQHYKNIKEVYRPFDGIWAVSANAFTQFCNESKIISKELPLKIADLTFITTNSMSGADWRTSSMVPQRGLVRFQFLESIVRLADEKYKKSGAVQTILEAVTALINNHLQNIYKKHQAQYWRQSVYLVEEVDILLKKFRAVFTNIYRKNSKLKVKPGEKPFMCLQQFKSLCERSGMLLNSIGQRNVFVNFNSSFMTQIDQVESERIIKMSEIEMIEAFARMANDVGFCNLTPDISDLEKQSRPFYKKFEEMIYVLIQTVCGDDIKNLFPIPTMSMFEYSKDDEDSD